MELLRSSNAPLNLYCCIRRGLQLRREETGMATEEMRVSIQEGSAVHDRVKPRTDLPRGPGHRVGRSSIQTRSTDIRSYSRSSYNEDVRKSTESLLNPFAEPSAGGYRRVTTRCKSCRQAGLSYAGRSRSGSDCREIPGSRCRRFL